MKKSLVFFFSLFLFLAADAQEITDSIAVSDAPHDYELPKDQWNDWHKIEEEWRRKQYPKILKESKLKMNCSGCSYIYMEAVVSIDGEGKLQHYKMLNSKKCTEPFSKPLEIKFMKWFFAQKFPPSLYNTRFQVRLGTGLKC